MKQGDMLVADYSEPFGYVVHAMSQEDFDKKFKPVDDPVKGFSTTINVDAKPILDRVKEIKAEMSTKIECVKLPDHAGFSESFIAELDKALNDYQQNQEQSSQHASTPHVRIELDDINDVPNVWIDGKRIGSFQDNGLVRLDLEWNADKGRIKPNHYYIEYHNDEDTSPYQYTGIGQTNETDE
ncbi:hypothetical protein [Lacticaseibacillus casei]|uniref:hypothetical protein n=1 Tax=Lacticaseibacillus casei TaxID=1582 RepID=UPI001CDBE2C6|nr:hypothetical protein [Lacticaseibacillus casei]